MLAPPDLEGLCCTVEYAMPTFSTVTPQLSDPGGRSWSRIDVPFSVTLVNISYAARAGRPAWTVSLLRRVSQEWAQICT